MQKNGQNKLTRKQEIHGDSCFERLKIASNFNILMLQVLGRRVAVEEYRTHY